MSANDLISLNDATEIGFKVCEMADRVRVMHSLTPGAQAAWSFKMDDTAYRVVITVEPPEQSRRAA